MYNTNCKSCGATLQPSATHCASCGTYVDRGAASTLKPPPPPQTNPNTTPATSTPYRPVDQTVSIGAYIWPRLLSVIPVVGVVAWIIAMIVIAAGGQNESYRNYAKAHLIVEAVGVGIALLFVCVL